MKFSKNMHASGSIGSDESALAAADSYTEAQRRGCVTSCELIINMYC